MHEMSIAESILEVARNQAAGRKLTKVHVRVGAVHRVVPDALTFGFELASQGTEAEGAVLEISNVPAVLFCGSCGSRAPSPDGLLACANCGGLDTEVLEGQELIVESLELEDGHKET